MTTELIQRFAVEHGISKIRAMVLITELIGKEKRSTGMDRNVDMVSGFSIEQLEWK